MLVSGEAIPLLHPRGGARTARCDEHLPEMKSHVKENLNLGSGTESGP
jgi:hypothetical protein